GVGRPGAGKVECCSLRKLRSQPGPFASRISMRRTPCAARIAIGVRLLGAVFMAETLADLRLIPNVGEVRATVNQQLRVPRPIPLWLVSCLTFPRICGVIEDSPRFGRHPHLGGRFARCYCPCGGG